MRRSNGVKSGRKGKKENKGHKKEYRRELRIQDTRQRGSYRDQERIPWERK